MRSPIISETQARLDLAGEFGVLYANWRMTHLENVALHAKCLELESALDASQAARCVIEDKNRELHVHREELASKLRVQSKKKEK